MHSRVDTYSQLMSVYFEHMDREEDRGQLARSTRRGYERLLNRTRPILSDALVHTVKERHLRFVLDHTTDTAPSYNNMRKALRRLFRFAKSRGYRSGSNPTDEIEPLEHETAGFREWSTQEVQKSLNSHPMGSTAHLTMCLLVFTSARRGDVVRLGPSNLVEHDGSEFIEFTQNKTKKKDTTPVYAPVHPYLKKALRETPTGDRTFLITEAGRPFSAKAFGERFRKWVESAGLPKGLTMHGVRKITGNELAEEECSQYQIMATHGHSSPKVSEIYTKKVRRRKLAEQSSEKARWGEKLRLPRT